MFDSRKFCLCLVVVTLLPVIVIRFVALGFDCLGDMDTIRILQTRPRCTPLCFCDSLAKDHKSPLTDHLEVLLLALKSSDMSHSTLQYRKSAVFSSLRARCITAMTWRIIWWFHETFADALPPLKIHMAAFRSFESCLR